MKKLFLLFTILTIVWSCEKDDNPSGFDLLMREKDKIDQAVMKTKLEGKWYGTSKRGSSIYLEFYFSSDKYGFRRYGFNSDGSGPFWTFDTQEYFFIKNDKYPEVYKLYALNSKGDEGEILSTVFKISKDSVYHWTGTISSGNVDEFSYHSITSYFDVFDENPDSLSDNSDYIIKLQREK